MSGSVVAGESVIKTVFWDIGGVLLSNGWDRYQRARVLTPLGVDLAEYEPRHEVANYYWERGHIDARSFFERTVFAGEDPGVHLCGVVAAGVRGEQGASPRLI